MHPNCRLIAAPRRRTQTFLGLQDFPGLQSSSVIQPVFHVASLFSILDLKKRQRHSSA